MAPAPGKQMFTFCIPPKVPLSFNVRLGVPLWHKLSAETMKSCAFAGCPVFCCCTN